jgi:hypothetical protein
MMTTTTVSQYLSKAEIKAIFDAHAKQVYQKKGTFLARYAEPGETILTIVAGRLETLAAAEWGDVILMNIVVGSFAERYKVPQETFIKRYDTTEQTIVTDGHSWMMVKAKGKVNAFQYFGPSVQFEAPWGEMMDLQNGDWLGNPVGGSEDDIYRIERETFEKTYGAE